MTWIKLSEQQPTDGSTYKLYMVYKKVEHKEHDICIQDANKGVGVAIFEDGYFRPVIRVALGYGVDSIVYQGITHWHEIAEPPEAE